MIRRVITSSSWLLVVLGVAILARTIAAGAGMTLALGYILGTGIAAAGFVRLYLMRITREEENPDGPTT